MESYDAVVAGAGPAGSTLARTLARSGLRVLLVEKETPGSRRVCGGFAGPELADFFSSVDLSAQFAALPKNEIHHVRISGARSGALDTSFPRGSGWSVDRSVIDAWLAREAVAAGAELSNYSTVVSADKISGFWKITVENDKKMRELRSRFFLVTTGRRVPRPSPRKKIFFACRTVYENTLMPSDGVTLHFARNGHVGLNPLGDGKVTMCLYVESAYLRSFKGNMDNMMEDLKRENRHLEADLQGAKRVSNWSACPAEPDHQRIFYRDGIFFAGDALTMVNPIVGGGMSVAAASADMLGRLIARGIRLGCADEKIAADYKKEWAERFAKRVDLAASLGMIERSRFLSDSLLFLMGSVPAVFSRLVRSTRKDPVLSAA